MLTLTLTVGACAEERVWFLLGRHPVIRKDASFGPEEDFSLDLKSPLSATTVAMRRLVGGDRVHQPFVVAADECGKLLLSGTIGSRISLLVLDVVTQKAFSIGHPPGVAAHNLGCTGIIADPQHTGSYLVAELKPITGTNRATLLRFSTELGGWVSSEVDYPLHDRPWDGNRVISHAGKLWWIDLSYGLLSCDPFANDVHLDFLELPEGCQLAVGTECPKMLRGLNVSGGKLRYVQIDNGTSHTVSMWTLADPERALWDHNYQVPLADIWTGRKYKKYMRKEKQFMVAFVDPSTPGFSLFLSWLVHVQG